MAENLRPPSHSVPESRIQATGKSLVNRRGRFVLYWMQAHRRMGYNFNLERAADWAETLEKPLVILEDLPCGHRWASRRHHRFAIDGMADNRDRSARRGVFYYPYVEQQPGAANELLLALGQSACLVVTDDYPIRRWSERTESAARDLPVLLERIDSNGLLPMRSAQEVFTTAHSFRRFLQRALPDHLLDFPDADPLSRRQLPGRKSLPREIVRTWPPAPDALLSGDNAPLDDLPIDQTVDVVDERGGSEAARKRLKHFLAKKLARYPAERNDPEADAASGLSPYLHFGHLSVHEVFHELARREGWSPDRLAEKPTGSREGWWGMSDAAEAFLDELITWREIGFNFCSRRQDYGHYESLPQWAQKTLAEHAGDRREFTYSLKEFEAGRTHDPLWNAAQMQLVREGRIHNYLRMLWGKKILEWTASPAESLEVMIELNNKYALDGEDPNSYSGIFWVLGRYDRAWGPEREVFGKIRYMSSENTARKVRVKTYLEHYA